MSEARWDEVRRGEPREGDWAGGQGQLYDGSSEASPTPACPDTASRSLGRLSCGVWVAGSHPSSSSSQTGANVPLSPSFLRQELSHSPNQGHLVSWKAGSLSEDAACSLMMPTQPCNRSSAIPCWCVRFRVLDHAGQVQGEEMKVARLLLRQGGLSSFLEVSGSVLCLPDQLVTLKDRGS